MTDGQMDLNNVCSWAQGENSSSMCPIEARISSNLHVTATSLLKRLQYMASL